MWRTLMLALTASVLYGCVANRNVPLPYSIAEALDSRDYLDSRNYRNELRGVRFYFGAQPHPAVEKSFGIHSTGYRSNAVKQESKNSCARALALALALLRMKRVALRMGGDAVINIVSNYRDNEVSSETHFQCATGIAKSAVFLKGTIVKLKNRGATAPWKIRKLAAGD